MVPRVIFLALLLMLQKVKLMNKLIILMLLLGLLFRLANKVVLLIPQWLQCNKRILVVCSFLSHIQIILLF
jgi:hypothetical protein